MRKYSKQPSRSKRPCTDTQRKHTLADDPPGEIYHADGVPSGRCKRRRLKSFVGDSGECDGR